MLTPSTFGKLRGLPLHLLIKLLAHHCAEALTTFDFGLEPRFEFSGECDGAWRADVGGVASFLGVLQGRPTSKLVVESIGPSIAHRPAVGAFTHGFIGVSLP